jgi:carbon monoxide dehydrogenase subunit G
MEVKLDKRYPVAAPLAQAWAVLADIRATAACMPGAQITEQLDPTHYKGTVKAKVGPAVMQFAGDIELQGLDAATRTLRMLGKGADRGGSSAAMQLSATLEPGADEGSCVLAGTATVTVSGKLAQFGSRLLVPVSDAMLAQFADNFRAAAQAAAPLHGSGGASAQPAVDYQSDESTTTLMVQGAQAPGSVPRPAPAAPVKELNALALAWAVIKGWFAGLFGRKT